MIPDLTSLSWCRSRAGQPYHNEHIMGAAAIMEQCVNTQPSQCELMIWTALQKIPTHKNRWI